MAARLAVLARHLRSPASGAVACAARQSRFNTQAAAKAGGAKPPVDINALAYGFMASQAMFAALEMGIFDKIFAAGNKMTIEQLNAQVGVAKPRIQTLLTALTSHGLVHRADDGTYSLADETAQFLVEGQPHYYGDYIRFQVGGQFYGRLNNLGRIMATGEAPTYSEWFSDPKEAEQYTRAQHNGSLATAKQLRKRVDLSNVEQLIDVGGGSGAFSIVLARTFPSLKSTVLELPEVAETGRRIVAEEAPEVAKRVEFKSGTALTEWPVQCSSADCVLMSYLSGSVPAELLLPLYKQAYQTLRPGGRLIVHDFMVDDSLDGPPLAALWALQHVSVNAEGLGLCPANVSAVMRDAGFEQVDQHIEMIGGLTKVVVATKAA